MADPSLLETIRYKYRAILADLDERASRRWAAAEAISLGRGGITAVALATGISDRTIRTGIPELKSDSKLAPDRQRRPGAGRLARQVEQPDLVNALERLVSSSTRGDPMSPLRWTCKSTRILAKELRQQGFDVGSTKVSELLKAHGEWNYEIHPNKSRIR